jgi:hypothetical protein
MILGAAWLVLVWAPANVPADAPYSFTSIEPGAERPCCTVASLVALVVVFRRTWRRLGGKI